LLADKLLIFSHNNYFAQDVIFVLIQLNSKQLILYSYLLIESTVNHKQTTNRQIFGFYF